MLNCCALALVALMLAGCSFGPDPDDVRARTGEVFEVLAGSLGEVDPAVLRTVEIVPEASEPCGGEGEESQQALIARGSLSVRAQDGAIGGILTDLANALPEEDWVAQRSDTPGQRAWSSEDGITVTLTDASPLVVIAVFGPCLPPVEG